MPGLLGIVGNGADNQPAALLPEMAQALKDESWYDVQLYHDRDVGLGRVSLGLVNTEPQPIWNREKTVCVVMEGELYDSHSLRKRLVHQGELLQTESDAELILHLYEEYGPRIFSWLNGAFIVGIWDQQNRSLTLGNDRLGLHPLYYAEYDGKFSFASGVRALMADPLLPRSIDYVAMAQMLAFEYVLGERTLLNDVKLLPPASILIFQNGSTEISQYWELKFEAMAETRDEASYIESLVHYLEQAVRRQVQGELPTGILLSGGLDSRLLLGLLSEELDAQQLHSFTFGVPGCDDARLAQELARKTGTHHHFFELRSDYLSTHARKGVELVDGMKSCAHMHVLATLESEAKHTRVIHKGFMGDALMGGHLNRHLWAEYDDSTLSRYLFSQHCVLFSEAEQVDLFTPGIHSQVNDAVFDSFHTILHEVNTPLAANKQDRFDIRQRQRRFILNGVELVRSQAAVRLPFCDNDLVEFAFSVPPGLRLDRALMVRVLAKAFPDLAKVPYEGTGLPLVPCMRDLQIRFVNQIRWRLRDGGLEWVKPPVKKPYADYNRWMRTALREWVEDILLRPQFLQRGYFRPDYIRKLVEQHMVGADHARKLGALIALELWHRRFLD